MRSLTQWILVAVVSYDLVNIIFWQWTFVGKRAKFLVAAAWILSIAFSVPIIFFYKLKEIEQYGNQCWIEFPITSSNWHWKLYMTLVAFSLFVIPAILIASCYFVIVITIWKKGKVMAPPTVTQSLLPRGEKMLQTVNDLKPKNSVSNESYTFMRTKLPHKTEQTILPVTMWHCT